MLSSKTKTGLSETIPNKSSPATPRTSKLTKGPAKSDSNLPSTLHNPRHSIDRSPRSVDLKPAGDRRSPRPATPDKPSRTLKASELQTQISALQEDLKKANERLASSEKERAHILDELKDVKRVADEANEKLSEALVAQKRAEDSSEIEKFRADELEQAGIEAAQKKEEEWQREMESVRNQHASDVAALLIVNEELQKLKQELAMVTEAKNTALSHADDAMKIAEINAEKVELLSNELARVKVLLDMKLEAESNESSEVVEKLNSEIESLKQEVERAKLAELKVVELEVAIESLKSVLNETKQAQTDASSSADEWKGKATLLETQLGEVSLSEMSASESLVSTLKQLEGSNALLQEAESEAAILRGSVESLETSVAKYKQDLEESNHLYGITKLEAAEMTNTVESLKSELENLREQKEQALESEKLSASSVQSLLEEKSKLMSDLEVSKDEEEKSKKAMESLASALHEVSAESREAKEKLSIAQAEIENAQSQIEGLEVARKAAEENYKALIDEAKGEINNLKSTVEKSQIEVQTLKEELNEKELNHAATLQKSDAEVIALKREMDKVTEDSKVEWEEKELGFISAIRKYEEEISTVQKEVGRLNKLLKDKEEELQAAKDDSLQLLNKYNEAEVAATSTKEVADKALGESLKLKDRLLDKENELQSIIQENEELRHREASATGKVEELSRLLEEATAKMTKENEELSNSEKDYDLLPKMDEFIEECLEERGCGNSDSKVPMASEGHKAEGDLNKDDTKETKPENANGKTEEADTIEVDAKTWDNCKINSKEMSPERDAQPEAEQESFEDEVDSKIDGDNFDQINGSLESMENGGTSPTKQQQKKKKPLLRKFGSLLKKKNSPK